MLAVAVNQHDSGAFAPEFVPAFAGLSSAGLAPRGRRPLAPEEGTAKADFTTARRFAATRLTTCLCWSDSAGLVHRAKDGDSIPVAVFRE